MSSSSLIRLEQTLWPCNLGNLTHLSFHIISGPHYQFLCLVCAGQAVGSVWQTTSQHVWRGEGFEPQYQHYHLQTQAISSFSFSSPRCCWPLRTEAWSHYFWKPFQIFPLAGMKALPWSHHYGTVGQGAACREGIPYKHWSKSQLLPPLLTQLSGKAAEDS